MAKVRGSAGEDFFPVRVGDWWTYNCVNVTTGGYVPLTKNNRAKRRYDIVSKSLSGTETVYHVRVLEYTTAKWSDAVSPPAFSVLDSLLYSFDTTAPFDTVDTSYSQFVETGDSVLLRDLPTRGGALPSNRSGGLFPYLNIVRHKSKLFESANFDTNSSEQCLIKQYCCRMCNPTGSAYTGFDSLHIMGSKRYTLMIDNCMVTGTADSESHIWFCPGIGYAGRYDAIWGTGDLSVEYAELLCEYGNSLTGTIHETGPSRHNAPQPIYRTVREPRHVKSGNIYSVNGKRLSVYHSLPAGVFISRAPQVGRDQRGRLQFGNCQ